MTPHISYFDVKKQRQIDTSLDGCELLDWPSRFVECPFARHPQGFPIFLHPEKLKQCDEYKDSDPYTVDDHIKSEFHRRRIDLTVKLIRETGKGLNASPVVLDLGCGQGHITHRISLEIPESTLYGLDYSVSAIEFANRNFKGINFAVGDAYEPPYAPRTFDIIICNNIWEHVADPLSLLGIVRRILKNDGYLIISTPSRYRLHNLVRVIRGKNVAFMSPYHVTEYTVGQVKEQLHYGGFDVIKVVSEPLSNLSMQERIAHFLARQVLSFTNSHHQLESTVFYLARARAVLNSI